MISFCLLKSWQIREAGCWILTSRKQRDLCVDKEYAWSYFPQDDAPYWALFVQQVGYTGPGGFFVNHTDFMHVWLWFDNHSVHAQWHSCISAALGEKSRSEFNQSSLWRDSTIAKGQRARCRPTFILGSKRNGAHHGYWIIIITPKHPCFRPQIDPTVGSGQRAATAARPRVTPPSAAGVGIEYYTT